MAFTDATLSEVEIPALSEVEMLQLKRANSANSSVIMIFVTESSAGEITFMFLLASLPLCEK
jgi:hypothetical protein